MDANGWIDVSRGGRRQLIFYPLVLAGAAGWTTLQAGQVLVMQWALKVTWEVLLTPVTYAMVAWLKRAEGLNVFDTRTDFTRPEHGGRTDAEPVRHFASGLVPAALSPDVELCLSADYPHRCAMP